MFRLLSEIKFKYFKKNPRIRWDVYALMLTGKSNVQHDIENKLTKFINMFP